MSTGEIYERKIIFSIKTVLAAAFFFTPIIFYIQSPYPYVTPKIVFFQVLVEFALVLWLCLIVFSKKYRPRLTPLTISLIFLFIISLVASYFGKDWSMSLWDVIDRKMGLVAIFHFLILYLILSSLHTKISFPSLMRVIAYSSIGVSAITLLQRFTAFSSLIPTENVTQPSGTFSNSLFLGSYLIFTIFFGLWLFFSETEKKRQYFALLGVLLGTTALFITESRSAIIGLTIGIITLLLYLSIHKNPVSVWRGTSIRKLSAIILIFILLFSFSLWFTRSMDFWKDVPGFNRLVSSSAKINLNNRIAQWQSALNGAREHPLLGWGWNNFDTAYGKWNVLAEDKTTSPSFLGRGNKPFNVFVEHLVSGGLVELISYIFVLILFFYQLFKTKSNYKPFMGALMVAYLVQSLANFDTIATYPLLFFLLALIDAGYKAEFIKDNDNENMAGALPFKLKLGTIFLSIAFIYGAYVINIITARAEYNEYLAEINSDNNFDASLIYWEKSLQIYSPYNSQLIYKFAVATRKTIDLNFPDKHLLKLGQYTAWQLELISKKSPANYNYVLTLANIYTSLSLYDKSYVAKAENNIVKATKLTSNNPEVYIVLAKIRLLQNNTAGALAALKTARMLDANISDPYITLAVLYHQIGESEKSNEEINKFEDRGIVSRNTEENILFGDIKVNKQEFGKAIEFYAKALKAKPSSNQVLFVDAGLNYSTISTAIKLRLTIAYYKNGNKEEAKKVMLSIDRKVIIDTDRDDATYSEYNTIFRDLELLP